MNRKTQIVVVGGGAGGLELVRRLGARYGRKRHDIILVDKNLSHIWKPLLHEVAAGSLDANLDEVGYRSHCHRWGYRWYATPDQSRNNLLVNVALFFGGIALHNTHHANPKACYLSRAWYEIDLVGCIANAIHRHTLANNES